MHELLVEEDENGRGGVDFRFTIQNTSRWQTNTSSPLYVSSSYARQTSGRGYKPPSDIGIGIGTRR
jgi:hypothetical protein